MSPGHQGAGGGVGMPRPSARPGTLAKVCLVLISLTFADAQGSALITYSGLHVFDARGRSLPAHFRLDDGPAAVAVVVRLQYSAPGATLGIEKAAGENEMPGGADRTRAFTFQSCVADTFRQKVIFRLLTPAQIAVSFVKSTQ